MSRSSKGFADFFPTAPSVLQQKRFKASQTRKRPRSQSGQDTTLLHTSSAAHPSSTGNHETPSQINHAFSTPFQQEQPLHVAEENDTVHGDLLNGVGSASSTSTSSSIFSTNHNAQGVALGTGNHGSASQTPLTNVESSPPHNNLTPSGTKHVYGQSTVAKGAQRIGNNAENLKVNGATTPAHTLVLAQPQARPARGEVKGVKTVYDPELDAKLPSKEKRARKLLEVTFGTEVACPPPFS